MFPKVLHLYGPVWINSYGLMIVVGIAVAIFVGLRHPIRKKLLSQEMFLDTIALSVLAAIVGGRILFILENLSAYKDNWLEAFYPWVGGFSSLGSVLAILIVCPIFLWRHNISALSFLDLIALHAPLVQGFARIGCFLAGCCYGIPAINSRLSVIYTHSESVAPLNIPLYPTQLFESAGSFLIFFILSFAYKKFSKQGQILFSYLILVSFARFVVDFWRGDWELLSGNWLPFNLLKIFSFSQLISITIFIGALIGFLYVHKWGRNGSV